MDYQNLLRQLTGRSTIVLHDRKPVGGGSINTCSRLETSEGFFFLKENAADTLPASAEAIPRRQAGMFEAEMKGLTLLSASQTFVVPKPLGLYTENKRSFLLLEWLNAGNERNSYEAGTRLAKLHRNTAEKFGLDHDNYIGSLPQSNTQHDSWAEFFTLERILPQVKRARDNGRIDRALAAKADTFCSKTGAIFPPEKPALLHGDLWSGNFFFSERGPAVFDPAVYYGHREMDLSMTRLFGGFDADFYAGYENEFALEKNWRTRIDFCNLYPLLVHVNLFGGGYVHDVKQILRQF